MAYPTYTKEMLATFTGRPLASFPEFVTGSALPQAILLFKIGTCLASLDDLTEDQQETAKYAILSMADAIHLAQPYQTALASPFNSESIGSYSYSKTAKQVSRSEKTGIDWFDIAVETLSVCDVVDDIPSSGGIEVFEHDASFVAGHVANRRMLSPNDIENSRSYGYDPAPGFQFERVYPEVQE